MPRMVLFWPKDRSGYHIRESSEVDGDAASTIIGEAASRMRLVERNGGSLAPGRDLLEIDGLYHRLAAVNDDDSLLEFVNRYGLLTHDQSEAVNTIQNAAAVVRSLIAAKDARDWSSLSDWLGQSANKISLTATRASGKQPGMFFQPKTLLDAVYLQFFEDMTGGAKLRLCARPGCGNWFKYGPGTRPPRRETAIYCGPRCQKAVAYAKLKESKS